MKTNMILRTIGLLVVMISLFALSSCSKNADQSQTKEQKAEQENNAVVSTVDEKDITESDEDLSTVDYQEFYDQLSANGEWVEVNAVEIGMKPQTASNNSSDYNSLTLSDFVGVKSAYADASAGMVFVWKPSIDLGVTTTVGEAPVYKPYTNGQWVNTDAGWYFKAPTPVEETVSHYGRWVNSPDAGWLWVPGRVWSPAWVDWKQNDDFVSWAPLPPSSYLVNSTITAPVIDDNNYVIVNRKYFLEPQVYKYYNPVYDNGNRVLVNELTRTDGIVVVNNTIINRGPDVNLIQKIYGRNIDLVKIQRVRNFNEVKYSDKEYNIYSPKFKKYKNKNDPQYKVILPKSYKKYDEWKEVKNAQKEYNKEVKKQEKELKKEIKNEEKQIKKIIKGNENGKKNSGNENTKYENEKGKKNNENEGNKKKGNKNNDNEGNKKKGND